MAHWVLTGWNLAELEVRDRRLSHLLLLVSPRAARVWPYTQQNPVRLRAASTNHLPEGSLSASAEWPRAERPRSDVHELAGQRNIYLRTDELRWLQSLHPASGGAEAGPSVVAISLYRSQGPVLSEGFLTSNR